MPGSLLWFIACSQPEASQVTSRLTVARSTPSSRAMNRADSPASAIIRTRVAALLLWLRS